MKNKIEIFNLVFFFNSYFSTAKLKFKVIRRKVFHVKVNSDSRIVDMRRSADKMKNMEKDKVVIGTGYVKNKLKKD